VERLVAPGNDVSDECRAHMTKKPVFLKRNLRWVNFNFLEGFAVE
jgi:hypothetical protein